MDSDQILARLADLLAYDAHSRRYQALPDFVRAAIGPLAGDYSSAQLQWDAPRFDWIAAAMPEAVTSSVELGSSLGYFSLRLAHERGFAVHGFEPVAEYAEACNLFACLAGMSEVARFHGRGVGIEDIEALPAADCLISLNVLHHAGNVFDREAVRDRGGWSAYAHEFLSRAAERFRHLVFQTGNSVKGVAHFPSEAALDTIVPLLDGAGWNVRGVGMVTDFETATYQNYLPDALGPAPRIGCRRNPETGLVEYRRADEVVAALPYGTLQRPLFYCERA
jgi:hypothetical protein